MPKGLSLYKIESDHRSSLYYDQYEWCVTVNIAEANCLRNLEQKQFEQALRNAKRWRQEIVSYAQLPSERWTDAKEQALRLVRDCLLAETEPFKTVVSYNTVCIYTNHSGLADRLETDGFKLRLVRQARVTKPANVVQLRESQYDYRTYFRERRINLEQRNMLANFLNSRKDTLRVSPALDNWVNGKFIGYVRNHSYSRAHYFVDHDHPNEGTMLSLIMPGIVRKTMPIETTK
jgi:hypothetical protein